LVHEAASSPQRWTSRWWPRHSGTVNSSLTFRGAVRTADDGHRSTEAMLGCLIRFEGSKLLAPDLDRCYFELASGEYPVI
jgi:hypothetical protein